MKSGPDMPGNLQHVSISSAAPTHRAECILAKYVSAETQTEVRTEHFFMFVKVEFSVPHLVLVLWLGLRTKDSWTGSGRHFGLA